jgi:hypothetical protein
MMSALFMEMAVKNPFVSIFLKVVVKNYACISIIYGR